MEYGARSFVKESYDKNDKLAKEKFISFLTRKGFIILNSKEDYNHDIIAELESKKYYFEVEMKSKYLFCNEESFPFNTVSFLGRKKRLHDYIPFYYVIICNKTNCFLICSSEEIYKDEYKEELTINTKDRKGLDLFYRVPKNKCKFNNF